VTLCSIGACEKPQRTRGWCIKHYNRWYRYGDPFAVCYIVGDDLARFWSKVDKTDICWLWTDHLDSSGYGKFKVQGKMVPAHRWAYEQFVEAIPEGLTIDHVRDRGCRYRHCVNPAHLEPVTPVVNTMRGDAPTAINARKTHCVNDHPFDEANTYFLTLRNGRTRRSCRACNRQKVAEYEQRKRLAV
jgi:hypothetical protein